MREKTQLQAEWKDYCEHETHGTRSWAGALETNGVYVSGTAESFFREDAALVIERAIRLCEARREDRNISAPCRTWAIDSEPTPDFPPEARTKNGEEKH